MPENLNSPNIMVMVGHYTGISQTFLGPVPCPLVLPSLAAFDATETPAEAIRPQQLVALVLR